MNAPTKKKPTKTSLYFNEDDQARVRSLEGKRVLIQRFDRYNNPYYQEILMPERPVHVARLGFRLLLDLAEGYATTPPADSTTKEE